MVHYSPQVSALESIVGSMLFVFFLYHTWNYDRWACFKVWNIRSNREAFRKLMIWGYLFAIPMNVFKGIVVGIIKFRVGFLPVTEGGFPVPYYYWSGDQQDWLNTIGILTAFIWWGDSTVHMEEVCFWFYLTSSKTNNRHWFGSPWFKIYVGGAVTTAIAFGLCTGFYLNNPLKLEAIIFLIYGLITAVETFSFLYVFYIFPSFISQLYGVKGTSEVLTRLLTFQEINKVRVSARAMFGILLLIVAADGLTEKQIINHSPATVDVMLLTAIICSTIGSVTTLLVFLPRNFVREKGLMNDGTTVSKINFSSSKKVTAPIIAVQREVKSEVIAPFESKYFRSIKEEETAEIDYPFSSNLEDSLGYREEDDGVNFQMKPLSELHSGVQFDEATFRRQQIPRTDIIASRGVKSRKQLPLALRNYSSPIDVVDHSSSESTSGNGNEA